MFDTNPYPWTIQDGPAGGRLYVWKTATDRLITEFYPLGDNTWSCTYGSFPEDSPYPPLSRAPYDPTGNAKGDVGKILATMIASIVDFLDGLPGDRKLEIVLFKNTPSAKLFSAIAAARAPRHGYRLETTEGVNTVKITLIIEAISWKR